MSGCQAVLSHGCRWKVLVFFSLSSYPSPSYHQQSPGSRKQEVLMRPQPFPAWAWSSTAALKVSRACPTSTTTKCWPAPLLAFPPEAAGIACQISLMSEAPALIGALGFVALTPVFIFKAGKGWVFFLSLSLSLSHAFSPWLMVPHSERPLQLLIGFNYWGN